jgi:hypothetical protein
MIRIVKIPKSNTSLKDKIQVRVFDESDEIDFGRILNRIKKSHPNEVHSADLSIEFFHCNIKSLKGCPSNVTDLNFSETAIRSLKYCPDVLDSLYLSHNSVLESLDGCPSRINKNFGIIFENNQNITSFDHFPKYVGGDLSVKNFKMKNLVGITNEIKNELKLDSVNLETLEGFPSYVGDVVFNECFRLRDLSGLKNIKKDFRDVNKSLRKLTLSYTAHCESLNLLNVLKYGRFKKLIISQTFNQFYWFDDNDKNTKEAIQEKEVLLNFEKTANIISKYLPDGNIFECQAELIEAGLEKFAN